MAFNLFPKYQNKLRGHKYDKWPLEMYNLMSAAPSIFLIHQKKKIPPLEQGINLLKYEEKSSKLDRLAEKENIQHALLLNSKEIHFIRKVIFFLHAF